MLPTKIVVIGAGSASFGLSTLAALIGSERLRGSRLALVDRNVDTLESIGRLARRLSEEWQAGMVISTLSHHADALEGAEFVILSIEVSPREVLWRSDYEIPLRYGVRQPYAENGGPGGFAHAARNIGPVMEIVHDMEQACPTAWLINFTNPMIRICDAVSRYSSIRVVGLCHQIYAGYGMVGRALAADLGFEVPEGLITTQADPTTWERLMRLAHPAMQRVAITAAGLNHFTWMLNLHDRQTGVDLYPLFRKRWASLDPTFEPLTRDVFQALDCFPIPGDEHLCEYLPWLSDPITKPWERYDIALYNWGEAETRRTRGLEEIARMGNWQASINRLRLADSEGAREVIENVAGAGTHYHLAVNLPNEGYITNLPEGAIVEVPGLITGGGVRGIGVGALPEPVAELCRRETVVARLCVDAAVNGDRQAALQCLLLDPVVTDMRVAQQILDDYLRTYRAYLPQFT